jgi:hypothetical protein
MALIRLKPDVTWQQLDGEVVALDLASATYVMANDTGSILWPLLEEGATDSELAAVLVDRFGIDAERASADVAAFVAQLRALTLVD